VQAIKQLRRNNTIIDKNLTWILTKRDRKQINIFKRKVYRRILENGKENWRMLNNKEIYRMVKIPL
jgi:hypothetical protein